MRFPSPIPTHSAVLIAPTGDSIANCSLRPGGEAPPAIQSPGCGVFGEWDLWSGPHPAPGEDDDRDPELCSCNQHLAAAAQYLSDRQDRQADANGAGR